MTLPQKSQGALLFNGYDDYDPSIINEQQIMQLIKYCLGILHHQDNTSPRRLMKAREILIAQGHRMPNYLPPALADKQHLDYFVDLFSEIIRQHPQDRFIDTLARNLTGALSNENQREGAFRVLGLEQVCGVALWYVVNGLKDNSLYTPVSTFFKQTAEFEHHRRNVRVVLSRAMGRPELAANAALILNSLAGKYGWNVGTQVNTATSQLIGISGLEATLN